MKLGEGSSYDPGRAHSRFSQGASDIPDTLTVDYLLSDVPFSSTSKSFTHDGGSMVIFNPKDDKSSCNKGLISARPNVGPLGNDRGGVTKHGGVVRGAGNELEKISKDVVKVAKKLDPLTFNPRDSKAVVGLGRKDGVGKKLGSITQRHSKSIIGAERKCDVVKKFDPVTVNRRDSKAINGLERKGDVVKKYHPITFKQRDSKATNGLERKGDVTKKSDLVTFNQSHSKAISGFERKLGDIGKKLDLSMLNLRDTKAINGLERKNDIVKKSNQIAFNRGDTKAINGREREGGGVKKFDPLTFNQRDSKSVHGLERKDDALKKVNPITVCQRDSIPINGSTKRKNEIINIRDLVSDKKPRIPQLPIKKETSYIPKKEFKAPKIEFKVPKVENKTPKIEDKYKVPNFKEFSFLKSTPGGFPKQSTGEDTSGPVLPMNLNVSNGKSVGASQTSSLITPTNHMVKEPKFEFKVPKVENKAPKIEDKYKVPNFKEFSFLKSTPGGFPKQSTGEDTSGPVRPMTFTVSNGNSVDASQTSSLITPTNQMGVGCPRIRPKGEHVKLEDVVEVKSSLLGVQMQSTHADISRPARLITPTVSFGRLVGASKISMAKAPINSVGASQISTSVTPINMVGASQISSLNIPINQMGVGCSRIKPKYEHIKLEDAMEDLSQPKTEANVPDGLLAVPLMKHQRIALSWMVNQEMKCMFCCGGILADDQGLGKTISTIALILKERSPSSKSPKPNEAQQNDVDMLNSNEDRPPAGTLIVCPTSVLRQWSQELVNKVTPEADLSVLVYHGGNRTKDPIELAKYDVVVTTYALVGQEVPKEAAVNEDDDPDGNPFNKFKKKKKQNLFRNRKPGSKIVAGPLSKVRWFRVVLDEAQCIKNHRTMTARACWGLHAKRRWCLSGTPIQNTIEDLYSYFRFLKYNPYANFRRFCVEIKLEIKINKKHGYERLRAVLKTFLLRRTKSTFIDGEPIIILPPKTIELQKIEFSKEERDFYTRLETDSRAQFQEYAAAGTVKENYAYILVMLLRLRQACGHPYLANMSEYKSLSTSSVMTAKKLPREKQVSLLDCLEASSSICGICYDSPEDAIATLCGHVYCNQCVCELIIGDDTECPADNCKTNLVMARVFSKDTLRAAISDQESVGNNPNEGVSDSCFSTIPLTSSKIKATLKLLLSISKPQRKNETTSEASDFVGGKANVFSQRKNETTSETSDFVGGKAIVFPQIKNETTSETSDFVGGKANMFSQIKNETTSETSDFVGGKAIVFSQWTKMLDVLEDSLKEYSIEYRRLDGTMSVSAREMAVNDFNTLPQVTVMIMSLKAASLGLNMVAANNVILLDLWWNPTTEDQAIDRAHRIGQTRPVSVYRLTVENTIEDRILELQQRKREIVASAFGEEGTSGGNQTRLSVKELTYLFGA